MITETIKDIQLSFQENYSGSEVIEMLLNIENELENLNYEISQSDISKEYILKRLNEIME